MLVTSLGFSFSFNFLYVISDVVKYIRQTSDITSDKTTKSDKRQIPLYVYPSV